MDPTLPQGTSLPHIAYFDDHAGCGYAFANILTARTGAIPEVQTDADALLRRLDVLVDQHASVPVCVLAGDSGIVLVQLVTAVRRRFPDIRIVIHGTEQMGVRDLEIFEGALHHEQGWIDVFVGRSSQNPTGAIAAVVRVAIELMQVSEDASSRPHTKPYWLWERRTDAQYPAGYPEPLARTSHAVIVELTDEQAAGIGPEHWSVQCIVPETPDLRHPSPRIILPPNEEIAALVTGGPRIAYVTTKGITQAWMDWISARGTQVLGRRERNTYLVHTTPALLDELRDQPWCYAVHRVYPFRKAQHPPFFDAFLRQAYVTPRQGEQPSAQAWDLRLVVADGADLQATTDAILAIGGQRFAEGGMSGDYLGFTLDPYQLHAALLRDDITYAEKFAYAVPSAQTGT